MKIPLKKRGDTKVSWLRKCCVSWTANEKRNLAFVLLFVAAYTNSFVTVPAAHSMFTNACKKEAMGHFCDTYGGCENQSYAVDYERDGFCVGTNPLRKSEKL